MRIFMRQYPATRPCAIRCALRYIVKPTLDPHAHNQQEPTMSKSQDAKKSTKKEPAKNAKEKKEAKKVKQEEKKRQQ